MRKKIFSKLMLGLLAMATGIAFTACGDDNDEPEVNDTWTTIYSFQATFASDFLEVADITAHIANPDGTFSDEVITKETNTWTFKGNKIPDQAAVLFTFVPKDNISADVVYNLALQGTQKGECYKNGELFSHNGSTIGGTSTPIKGDRVAEYLTKKGAAMALGTDSDGKVVFVDAEDIDFGLNGVWEWLAGILVDN